MPQRSSKLSSVTTMGHLCFFLCFSPEAIDLALNVCNMFHFDPKGETCARILTSIQKPRLPPGVPHSAIRQRVDVMDELLLCQKNTSMGEAGGGITGYSCYVGMQHKVSILQGMALHGSFHMPQVSLNMALLKGALNIWRFHRILRANKSFQFYLLLSPIHLIPRY